MRGKKNQKKLCNKKKGKNLKILQAFYSSDKDDSKCFFPVIEMIVSI